MRLNKKEIENLTKINIEQGNDDIYLNFTHEEYICIKGILINKFINMLLDDYRESETINGLLEKFQCDKADFDWFHTVVKKIEENKK